MAAEKCIWCGSFEVVTIDPDGDGCCARCSPMLDPEGCCGHCGEGTPIKMLGLWPACAACLERDRKRGTVRETIERIAADAGVTGDIWSLSLKDFVATVLEHRCMKLGLIKARGVDVTMQVVANEVGGGR